MCVKFRGKVEQGLPELLYYYAVEMILVCGSWKSRADIVADRERHNHGDGGNSYHYQWGHINYNMISFLSHDPSVVELPY